MKKPNTELRIPAIEAFLQAWKAKAMDWYMHAVNIGNEKDAAYKQFMADQLAADPSKSEYDIRKMPEYQKLRLEARDYWWYQAPKEIWTCSGSSLESITYKLNTMLDEELIAKRNSLIYRTVEKIGEITDAKALDIGYTGEIEGLIIGTTGKARIESITAGGYNIQCFHFRVLIHVIK